MRKIPIAQINHSAIQVLYKEIGVVNTMRFLNQFSNGQGNYTEEREQIWGDMSVDEIAAEISKERQRGKFPENFWRQGCKTAPADVL